MREIVYSGMITPDGHLLESLHRHMYVTHEDKNGKHYMLDGGNDYIRCSVNGDEKFITLYSDSPIEEVRNHMVRWNQRKQKYILLKDIDDDWLEGVLEYYIDGIGMNTMDDKFLIQFIKEKQYRNLNLIQE